MVETSNDAPKLLVKRLKLLSDYPCMLFDFSKNGQGDLERAQAVFTRHRPGLACGDGIEKRFDFELERLVFRGREWRKPDLLVAGYAERGTVLPLIIDGDVLMRLE